jgi:hypothetical protein
MMLRLKGSNQKMSGFEKNIMCKIMSSVVKSYKVFER